MKINTVINEYDCEKLQELNKNALYGEGGVMHKYRGSSSSAKIV